MWPFKKREVYRKRVSVDTVLCIPGTWVDQNDFLVSLVAASGGKLVGGGMAIIVVGEDKHFQFSFETRDERLVESFRYGGKVNRVSEDFLERVNEHTSVVYLKSEDGSIKSSRQLAEAASTILNTKGLGVLVESAGKAFEGQHWQQLLEQDNLSYLMDMFVLASIYDSRAVQTSSCGMHNFGHPDACVRGADFQDAVQLLRVFNFYQLAESPLLRDGQTFGIHQDSVKYRLSFELSESREAEELYYNPFGIWVLSAV